MPNFLQCQIDCEIKRICWYGNQIHIRKINILNSIPPIIQLNIYTTPTYKKNHQNTHKKIFIADFEHTIGSGSRCFRRLLASRRLEAEIAPDAEIDRRLFMVAFGNKKKEENASENSRKTKLGRRKVGKRIRWCSRRMAVVKRIGTVRTKVV